MSGKAPDAASLHEAALTHLSRYAATEASLGRALGRRIERWQRQQEQAGGDPDDIAARARPAKAAIPTILAQLRKLGVLNDDAFAQSRARRLTREGKSRRATMAHLAAKGVRNADLPDDPARELAAACAYLRRRRAGPFGDAPAQKILAAMARGGFSQSTARQAMSLTREAAEALIEGLSASAP